MNEDVYRLVIFTAFLPRGMFLLHILVGSYHVFFEKNILFYLHMISCCTTMCVLCVGSGFNFSNRFLIAVRED